MQMNKKAGPPVTGLFVRSEGFIILKNSLRVKESCI
jgi:hypothetical protein